MKRLILMLLVLAFTASACTTLQPNKPPITPTPAAIDPTSMPWDDRSIFSQGLVQADQDVLNKLPGASVYHIEYELDASLLNVKGQEQVFYTNTEDAALSDVELRLLPNLIGGQMDVSNLLLDGQPVTPAYSMSNSLVSIPLATPLEPGKSVSLSMDFSIIVPQTVDLNYGVLAYAENVLALAHSYPMIPVYDDQQGWNAEVPPSYGDLTFTDMAFFIVKVTAPADLHLVAVGREIGRSKEGSNQVVTYAAGPVRDFYLAASPDYQVISRKSGETTLNLYVPDKSVTGAQNTVRDAAQALEDFSRRYGPYPYTELDLVGTPTQALGIEYPGMIALAAWLIDQDHAYLEATVAHEVAHMWFYNLVGSDQLDQPWMDESMAQFVTMEYFFDQYGAQGRAGYRASLASRWDRVGDAMIPIGLPVAGYTAEEYGAIVYGRGGLFFEALRQEMSPDKFDAFMKDYVSNYAWGIATSDDLKVLAEKECSCDLEPLWAQWVNP